MRILIVEDHRELAETLAAGLRREGMAVDVAFDGTDGLERTGLNRYDVVVLDRDLPGVHGDDVCRALVASRYAARLLMLTAAATIEDRVDGLSAGADDYLPKPFATEELLARVRALLRRSTPTDGESQILSFADVRLDPDRFEAWRGGRPLHLTRTEFSLLEVLVRNATRVLTRDALFEAIWGFDMSATANNLQVYVSYLRRKMEAEGEPRLIYTLRGLGYTLRETPP